MRLLGLRATNICANDSTEMYAPMTVALKFRATGYYANGHWREIIEIGINTSHYKYTLLGIK